MRDDVGSGLLTAKNDPSAHSPFQDALLEETAKLGVVRARFDGFARHTFDELIEGYSSMKVLTYSSSIPIINRTAGELEKLEVVFRSEDIHGTVAKLRRDVPDYLYGSGSKGNVIVFETEELERFLGVSMLPKKGPFGALARLLAGRSR